MATKVTSASDHQRRSGGGSAGRVSHRVVAGEDPGSTADRASRRAQNSRERADDLGRVHGDPEEEKQHSETDREQSWAGRDPAGERPEGDKTDGDEQHDEGRDRPVLRPARDRQHRPLAHGSDRRHPCGTSRRAQACDQRDQRADDQRDDDRPRRKDGIPLRQVDSDRDEQLVQDLREAEPEEQPDDGGDEADDQSLEDDGPQDLAARCADRPQRRELARPLGDRDRKRVRDHERADEEGNEGESEQRVAQEVDEPAEVLAIFLDLRLHVPNRCR
jgi:hypothetical protein